MRDMYFFAGSITSPASYKGRKRPTPRDDIERFDEEEWPLRDVIFVEDTRPVPIGEVLAVDGIQVSSFLVLLKIYISSLIYHVFRAEMQKKNK